MPYSHYNYMSIYLLLSNLLHLLSVMEKNVLNALGFYINLIKIL